MLRNKKGTIIPLFVVLLTVIIGFGALVADLSQSYSLKARVKSAVDEATLAGISQLVGPATVSDVKNLALQYLNNNLTMTIPSFNSLSLNSEGLSIQAGIYDFNNMTFTWDEVSSNVNALMISYSYNSKVYFGNIFMIGSVQVADKATAAKQPATKALPRTGFPLVINSAALSTVINNMVDLYSATSADNSLWTDYTNNNPSTTDIKKVLDYFQLGAGVTPPQINVSDTIFATNDGGMAGIFMSLDSNVLVGMTYLLPVVTPVAMTNQVTADGFVGATINAIVDSMGSRYVTITIIPGFVDNTFGGLGFGSSMTTVSSANQSFLANAYGLVQ